MVSDETTAMYMKTSSNEAPMNTTRNFSESKDTSVAINLLISVGACTTVSVLIVVCVAGIKYHFQRRSQRLRYFYIFSVYSGLLLVDV